MPMKRKLTSFLETPASVDDEDSLELLVTRTFQKASTSLGLKKTEANGDAHPVENGGDGSEHKLSEVMRMIHGGACEDIIDQTMQKAIKECALNNFDLKAYRMSCGVQEERPSRVVRIGLVQFGVSDLVDTTKDSVAEMRQKISERAKLIISAAGGSGKCNIVCLQEAWPMPFAFCTREKAPWLDFAEDAKTGPSAILCSELAKKYNMVIVSPILERDEVHGNTIHNTAVVWSNTGKYIGKHRKNHIPRIGDFNEATYYMEGDTGHPVFETQFGKIGINICYGRHHPLNWMAFGLNGAEIVFNPSATIGTMSEPMWPIEARNAAIANR